MIKFSTSGIAIASLLGALLVGGTHAGVLTGAAYAKGDRLHSQAIAPCSPWPYYHHVCQHDLTNKNRSWRKVRIISQTNHRKTRYFSLS